MPKKSKKEKKDDKKLSEELSAQLKYLQGYRFEHEKTWWEIQNFIKGKHYLLVRSTAYYDRNIRFEPITRRRGEVVRVFNFFRKVYKELKSMITIADYRWSVIGGSEESIEEKYLSWFFKKYSMKKKIAQIAGFGFKRGAGYLEIYWDGKKPSCNALDPFLVYEDPHGKFFLKSITKRKRDLEDAGVYKNLDKISPANKPSHSKLYNQYYQTTHQDQKQEEEDDYGLGEYLLLERYEVGEDGWIERIITKDTETEEIIRNEKIEPYLISIEKYSAESDEECLNDPLLKPVLDPAKALDRTCNLIEGYIRAFCRGRYYIKRGQSFKEMRNSVGQVLQYDLRKPEAEVMQSLPPTVHQYKEDMVNFHESLSGASLRQIKKEGMSGKALAFLQAFQQQNAVEPMENMKDFLVRVGMRILQMLDEKLAEGEEIYWKEGMMTKQTTVIGKTASFGITESANNQIKKPLNLEIEILPGGAFARLNQQETVKEMYRDGAIDIESYHEIMAIGNVGEIIRRMKVRQGRERTEDIIEQVKTEAGKGGSKRVKGSRPAAIAKKSLKSQQEVVGEGMKTAQYPSRVEIKKP